ncbi:MAG: TlpA family protein disulfide reductase [Chloroflexota bacterium]|nr:TlpA family protein disulfide reductase [Chloroflexota bacterium]
MNRHAKTLPSFLLLVLLVACSGGDATAPIGSQPPSTVPAVTSPDEGSITASPTEAAMESSAPASVAGEPTDALLAVELTDVRSGETFTLGDLAEADGPVLLEPMAVWCTNCVAQQREVVTAHETGDFASVSLDVDLSESPEDLAAYADREGFDWHFAMADPELYRALQDRFGVASTNPPSTPLIIIGADGTVTPLEFGRGTRGAQELLAELGAG